MICHVSFRESRSLRAGRAQSQILGFMQRNGNIARKFGHPIYPRRDAAIATVEVHLATILKVVGRQCTIGGNKWAAPGVRPVMGPLLGSRPMIFCVVAQDGQRPRVEGVKAQ